MVWDLKAILQQAGYDLGTISVSVNGETRFLTARQLKSEFKITEKDLIKYNLTWESKLPINFDINIKLKPTEWKYKF